VLGAVKEWSRSQTVVKVTARNLIFLILFDGAAFPHKKAPAVLPELFDLKLKIQRLTCLSSQKRRSRPSA
jgi:hypothetical protein